MKIIDGLTREDAIKDGILIDVTELAKEAKIKYPVALTDAVNKMIKDKPDIEDIEGRTWDIVWMLRCAIVGAIKSKKVGEDLIYFDLILNDSKVNYEKFKPKMITLKALIHGGDAGEPVITIMLPKED